MSLMCELITLLTKLQEQQPVGSYAALSTIMSLFSGLGPPTQKSPQGSPVFNVALNAKKDENENRRNVEEPQGICLRWMHSVVTEG